MRGTRNTAPTAATKKQIVGSCFGYAQQRSGMSLPMRTENAIRAPCAQNHSIDETTGRNMKQSAAPHRQNRTLHRSRQKPAAQAQVLPPQVQLKPRTLKAAWILRPL